MIIALSPEQLQEMAKVFEAAQAPGTFEAPWWMSNEAVFPNQTQDSETEKKKSNETRSSENATSAPTADDTKPSTKTSPEDTAKQSCPRRNGNCRAYGCDPNTMFQHCLRMKEAARRQREAKQARIVEQKTPIHMHQETDAAAKMSLDLAGFSASNISVHVENYIVSIVANRTNKLGDVFVVDRRFRLDKKTANPDEVTATFEDGILELTVPKKSVVGPRKIPIVVPDRVGTEDESLKRDDETSKASNLSPRSSPVTVAEEPVDNAESTVDTSPKEDQSQEAIFAETVEEQNETIEEEEEEDKKDNNPNTIDIVATDSEAEDETSWEEVTSN